MFIKKVLHIIVYMPNEMKKFLFAVTLGAVIPIAMIYFGGGTRDGVPEIDRSLRRVLDSGRLVLGFDVGFPPMSFIDDKDEIAGFDIDMVQEVCDRLGVALVKRPINWGVKESELNGGTVDCIVSVPVTKESGTALTLLEPYIQNDLIFVVPGSSNVKWPRDLKDKIIGVQYGSATQKAFNASNIRRHVMARVLDDDLSILRQLKEDKLDAGLVDSLAAYYFIYSSSERYFVLADSLGEEELTIGFRKNDRELRDKVQEIVSDMKGDGTLGEISEKWFGSDITIVR